MNIVKVCIVSILLLSCNVFAVDYYIDFDGGSDSNNGTATGTAWKHCKGDPNATGNAASTTLVAGDIVNFKGGVRYLGAVTMATDGSSGNHITYRWDGAWGAGQPIIDGSVPFTGTWTVCPDSATAFGNANWAKIYTAPIEFAGQETRNTFILNDEFLAMSQSNVIEEPIFYDYIPDWATTARTNLTATTLTLSSVFTQTDSAFWVGALISIHRSPNAVFTRAITSFDTSTDTVTMAASNDYPGDYYDPTPYAILGHPLHMIEGTYCVIGSTIYYWPTNDINPNTQSLRVGKLPLGFTLSGGDYLTIDNLKFTGYFGTALYEGSAIQRSGSYPHNDVTIKNCTFKNIRCWNQEAVCYLPDNDRVIIEDCAFSQCMRTRGIVVSKDGCIVRRNTFDRLGGTNVFFTGTTNGICEDNVVTNARGAHGNGLSFYGPGLDGMRVSRNHISSNLSPITFERASNIQFDNNFVDGGGVGQIDEWSGQFNSGYVRWWNNTLVNSYNNNHYMLNVNQNTGTAQYDIRNNIVDGMSWNDSDSGENYPTTYPWCAHSYNIWVGKNGTPDTYGTGGSYNTDLASIFTDYASGDWTLKSGSPAIGTGTNLSAYFTTDINGVTRTSWDIGAYAYNGAPAGVSITTGVLRIGAP